MQTYLAALKKSYYSSLMALPVASWRGIALSFIESILAGVFVFLSFYLVNTLHLNIAQAGKIIATYGVGAMLGGLVGGKLADRISPAWITAACLAVQGTTYLLLTQLSSPLNLMLDVFIMGMATYGFITSNYLWVMNQCRAYPQQKMQAINLLSTASNLGGGIASLFVSYFAHAGFHRLFLMTGSCLLLLSAFTFLNETVSVKPTQIDASTPTSQALTAAPNRLITYLILMCVLLVGSVVAQLSSNYSIYIEASFPQFGLTGVSILFVMNCLLVVLLEIPLGNWLGKYNKILLVGISCLLAGIGMSLLSVATFFLIAILSSIIYTLGEIIFFCFAQYVLYHKASANRKGESLGLFRLAFASSRVLGPAAGGYIYHQFGGAYVWYACGLIGIVCFIPCYLFRQYD